MEALRHSLEAMSLISEVNILEVEGRTYKYFDLVKIADKSDDYQRLPYCLRIIFEACVRKAASTADPEIAAVWAASASEVINRRPRDGTTPEILFQPGRVVLQDFTGVAALVDLASMRDVVASRGQDPSLVDSKCPADLVVDHSVQVDFSHIEKLSSKQQRELAAHQTAQPPSMGCQDSLGPQQILTFPPFFPASASGEVFYNPPVPAYFPIVSVPPQFVPPIEPVVQQPPPPNNTVLVPTDNPGLPIQDEVCPFHQRLSYWSETLQQNRNSEMEKNCERFQFLKWVDSSFDNITVIPPGTGVMHQVNLEYLARIVAVNDEDVLFPDSCVGTDTHTTMINGLGVLGWTVCTLQAEAVMFGHPITLQLPKVIGVKLIGKVPSYATSTDVVLLITKELRKQFQVSNSDPNADIFVEFFGPAVDELSIADRSAIANLCGEYNAKIGFFPVDNSTLRYLAQTGREKHSLSIMKKYLERVALLRDNQNHEESDAISYDEVVEIFLPDIVVTISGPTKSKDKVELEEVAKDFRQSLTDKFGLNPDQAYIDGVLNLDIDGQFHSIQNGSILMTSIASCSNTSNPSVMLTAGLLAKKAVEAGLSIPKFVKRSLSPGSGVVTSYLQDSGVMPYLHMLGFEVVGYGCSSCVENSSCQPLIPPDSLVCCSVLAGNRNFEGRIVPEIKANYLASPPLVIAYAIAGKIDIDFSKEPIGYDANDEKPIFLHDIWPTRSEVQEVERCQVIPSVFKLVSNRISFGNKEWSALQVPSNPEDSRLYQWNQLSTFIRPPNYLQEMMTETLQELKSMRCLLKLEDNVTCDLISPAGSIVRTSPAAEYLSQRGLVPRQFHSYGARRGNSEVMARGTFSHAKIKNVMKGNSKQGPFTVHQPSGVVTSIFDASNRYKEDKVSLLVIAGKNFGRGTTRDWATKGPFLLGVRAILAVSFSPVYRDNMIKTGLLPVEIEPQTYAALTGHEAFELKFDLEKESSEVYIVLNEGEAIFKGRHRLDNAYEKKMFKDGGVLRCSLRTVLSTEATSNTGDSDESF